MIKTSGSAVLLKAALLLFFCNCTGFGQFNFLQDVSITNYNVSGNASQSAYPKNQLSCLYEGKAFFNQQSKNSNSTYYGNIFYRTTDDKTIDLKKYSISSLVYGYKNDTLDIVTGDNFISLSELSMVNALRGAKAEYGRTDGLKITIAGGDTANWEDLFEKKSQDSALSSLVYGARAQLPLFHNSINIGVNYANSSDNRSYFNNSLAYKDKSISSMDIKYLYGNALTLKSEYAQSSRKLYSDDSGSYTSKDDKAYKAGALLAGDKYNFSFDYSRIGPDFETTGGFTSQDLESFQLNDTYMFNQSVSIRNYVYLSRDNLENTKETRSNRMNPGVSVSFRLPLSLGLDCSWDLNKEYTDNKNSDNKTETVNARITKPFKPANISFNYSRAYTEDFVNANQGRERNTASIGFDGTLKPGKSLIAWNIYEQADVTRKLSDDSKDVLLTHSGGMRANLPGGYALDGRFMVLDSNYNSDSGDSRKYMFELSAGKIIRKWINTAVTYTQNDNYFNENGNNYFENKITGKVSCKF